MGAQAIIVQYSSVWEVLNEESFCLFAGICHDLPPMKPGICEQ